VRVVADQVARAGDAPGELGVRPYPAALKEERPADPGRRERLEDSVLAAGLRRAAGELRVEGQRDLHHCASVTLVRPTGWSESRPLAVASAPANSWPGTTESSGERSADGASGTGSRWPAPSIFDGAFPLATSVAPAARALFVASMIVGSVSSFDAIVHTGNSGSSAAIGPWARSVEVSGSAATRQVSVSLSAISRAVANSMPRPITY